MIFEPSYRERPPTTGWRRRAAAAVEAGIVLSILFLLFIGIFEYLRFVFLVQIAENAAREGARFAVARTGDGTTEQAIKDEVTARMFGRQHELQGYQVEVLNVNPATGVAIPNSQWSDAPFGGAIMVRVSGVYSPMAASLLRMPSAFTLRATAMMSSEAN
jgi:Flp pilus assembly protein TadG